MFFRNKHVITSLIVAPILALISYYTVDQFVKERPQAAVEGKSYPLVAKSNCRYSSGECDLINESFKAKLTLGQDSKLNLLKLSSTHSLQGVKVGFSKAAIELDTMEAAAAPLSMQSNSKENRDWSITLQEKPNPDTKLFIAMSANGAHYYAETTMEFIDYETSFNKNFRKDK